MKIEPGAECVLEMTVSKKDTALSYGSGALEVFATPAMVALMEKASVALLDGLLEANEDSVGIAIDVKHLKATPIGEVVRCESRLARVEGKKLFFIINAADEEGKIGEATHVRYLIDPVKFMERVARK